MSPVRDTSLAIRATSDGAFTATTNIPTAIDMEGTSLKGMALKITLSSASGTSPTLTVTILSSTTTTAPTTDTTRVLGKRTALAPAAGGTSNPYVSYIIPFVDPQCKSLSVLLAANGTSPSFASVEVYVVQPVGDNWDRSINFH